MDQKPSFLKEVLNALSYQREMGATDIPIPSPHALTTDVAAPKSIDRSGVQGKNSPPVRKAQDNQTPSLYQNSGSPSDKAQALDALFRRIDGCTRCRLCEGRTKLVFGVGNPDADLMFVGEGPGRDEDLQGEPFVGRAGQLLTKIIQAMGFQRSDVYIGNIVKCRPPNNRTPLPDEMTTCIPFLREQIEIINPKIIVCLGSVAVQGLLQTEEKISRLRGKFQHWDHIRVMPTFHPAFLLRNPNMKKEVWEDMQKVMQALKEKP